MSFPTSENFPLENIKTLEQIFIIETSFTIYCFPLEKFSFSSQLPEQSYLYKPYLDHLLSLTHMDHWNIMSCMCRKRVLRRLSHQMSPQLKGQRIVFHRVQVSCHLIIDSSCILICLLKPAGVTGALTSKGGVRTMRRCPMGPHYSSRRDTHSYSTSQKKMFQFLIMREKPNKYKEERDYNESPS